MKEIVFPMKVHAVKLEYRRLRLENMMRGNFRTVNGVKCVVVTYDPEKPKISVRHPRIIHVDTRLGKQLSEAVNSYLKIKKEYDDLRHSWNSRYNFAPPRVNFPIVQFSDPHKMNNAYFQSQQDKCGSYVPKTPTVSEHGDLKSKNEQMTADLLKYLGIPFKYETELFLTSIEETIDPDYLVNFYEIDRCSYVEILGMSEKIDYSIKTATKIIGFSKDRYRPGREVIYIILYDKQNFDADYVISQILSAFDDMIPDNALIWENTSQAV
ncbi:hypothetical protein [Butyrivibrio sp. AE2032]|uniref:hypothetical protein n=1 Tax=Butyrivibrio sp. AE2032 TaxID=1458463 RepID=UPI000557A9FF|nr:hypothetical protein [Butyrivibrio sp. AE2032]